MNVSSASSVNSLLLQSFQKFKANGGATKDDLTSLQSALGGTDATKGSKIDDLIDSFTSIDTNNDGKLSGDEIKTYTRKSGGGGGHHCHGGPSPADGDSNGVSKDDLTALDNAISGTGVDDDPLKSLISSFDDSDTDHDGKISASELKAYAEKTGTSASTTDSSDQTSLVSATDTSTAATTSTNPTLLNLQKLLQSYLQNTTASDDSTSLISGVTA